VDLQFSCGKRKLQSHQVKVSFIIFLLSNSKLIAIYFKGVKFTIGGDKESKSPVNEPEDPSNWEVVWACQTAIPVYHMAFSPDGTLFATCGRNDRLVKIWYENKQGNHHYFNTFSL